MVPPNRFIKNRLCWMGNSFCMYLDDTSINLSQHRDALALASDETSGFITASIAALMANQLTSNSALPNDTPVNQEMGSYEDEMD